ncbi:MAG: hypothetical protein JNK87_24280 [Bryobacterales bacterium]|nr:hypothetical protein [Bryobacterales bacterium]
MRDLFHKLDPRTRIVAVTVATILVASTTPGHLLPFALYLPFTIALILTSRASGWRLLLRVVEASPFILLAAGLLVIRDGLDPAPLRANLAPAASVALKGYTAALLLAFLMATTPLADLLWALRKMHAPESLNLILSLMFRYTSLMSEEHSRLERARESRTARPLGHQRYAVYGRQLGTLLIRSWDRAERVHSAMLSRGFNGGWPSLVSRSLRRLDWQFAGFVTAAFCAARLL